MPAYVIVEVEVTDPKAYEGYKPLAGASIAAAGGKFVVRGGKAETLEGDWKPERIVVLEFESVEAARKWYDSPGYAEAKAIRQRASRGRMIVVEGFSG